MYNRKYKALTWMVAAGIWATTQMASAGTFEAVKPVGKYPLKIVFVVNKELDKSCHDKAPPALLITLDRNHPERASKLELNSGWPYSNPRIIESDRYNSQATSCHFTDEVTRTDTHVKMLLKGTLSNNKSTGQGIWTDSAGCAGSFTIFRQQ